MNLGYAIRQNKRVEERRREREQREENPLMGLRKNEYETKKNERERERERRRTQAYFTPVIGSAVEVSRGWLLNNCPTDPVRTRLLFI